MPWSDPEILITARGQSDSRLPLKVRQTEVACIKALISSCQIGLGTAHPQAFSCRAV